MKITTENQTVTNQEATRDEKGSASVSNITDFFEVRHQLMLENRQIDNIQEATIPGVNDNSKHELSLASAKFVEEAVYWFVSAPALLYLVYIVIRPLIGIEP